MARDNLDCDRPTAIKDQWEVEFSRFFNFPCLSSSSSSNLKPPAKFNTKTKGTWISSSIAASLYLLSNRPDPDSVLVVSIRGKVYEEHFVSNLNFSWPQVSCAIQCESRGSRVVFASFIDCSLEIQKFSLRFSTNCAAQTFLYAVKESVKDKVDFRLPRNDTDCENTSQTEFNASSVIQHRADEESSFVCPIDAYTPKMPVLRFTDDVQHVGLQKPLQTSDFEDDLTLPPSFTALLTNCITEIENENGSTNAAENPDETDLQAQITKYMSDASFQDMLTKIEKAIDDLGGDLIL